MLKDWSEIPPEGMIPVEPGPVLVPEERLTAKRAARQESARLSWYVGQATEITNLEEYKRTKEAKESSLIRKLHGEVRTELVSTDSDWAEYHMTDETGYLPHIVCDVPDFFKSITERELDETSFTAQQLIFRFRLPDANVASKTEIIEVPLSELSKILNTPTRLKPLEVAPSVFYETASEHGSLYDAIIQLDEELVEGELGPTTLAHELIAASIDNPEVLRYIYIRIPDRT